LVLVYEKRLVWVTVLVYEKRLGSVKVLDISQPRLGIPEYQEDTHI
jgi:hypothetical protein